MGDPLLDPSGDPLLDPDGDVIEAPGSVDPGSGQPPTSAAFIQADINVGIGGEPVSSASIQADINIGVEGPGAYSHNWGPNIRLFVWLGIGRGNTLILDHDVYGHLDAGNVAGGVAGLPPEPVDPLAPPGLWVDVSCAVISVEMQRGATTGDGVFAKAEAGTATLVISDPHRAFDPIDTPLERLGPGCGVLIWCQVLQDLGAGEFILRRSLFRGQIDSIAEPWNPHASERRATIIASDGIADLVNRERPELAVPEEFVHERLARILDYYEGPPLLPAVSTVRLAATTLSGSAWEEIQRAVDAELGFAYVTPRPIADWTGLYTLPTVPAVRFLPRGVWDDESAPAANIPCGVIINTTVADWDQQARTRVTASAKDGPVVVRAQPGAREVGYTRTDLALTDAGVPAWADTVLAAFAKPPTRLTGVTLRPGAQPYLWLDITALDLVADRVVVAWDTEPFRTYGLPHYVIQVTARVIGISHSITHARWEVGLTLADAEILIAE